MSCNRCKKRSLTHIANNVFKDPRIAKKWLSSKDDFFFKNQTPLEMIADQNVTDKESVVLQLYISAAMDMTLFDRENYDDRVKRLVNMTTLMGVYRNQTHAKAMIMNDYMISEKIKIAEMLKTNEGTERFQSSLLRSYYGVYA